MYFFSYNIITHQGWVQSNLTMRRQLQEPGNYLLHISFISKITNTFIHRMRTKCSVVKIMFIF